MVKVEYEYIREKDKFVNVSYNLKTDDKNWKEILKKEFCNIIDSNEDIIYIKFGTGLGIL
ncbi:hypothetical protein KAX02_00540 [candidate division WOR-3 bacterium]|nr:hypothetical protein [candidate division WOR-3 bacterium]